MKLPLHIAKKLLLLTEENSLPASSFSTEFTNKFLADGILIKQSIGRTKHKLSLKNKTVLSEYLKNQYGVSKLEDYITALENENLKGHQAIEVSSDSKIKKIRAFKGFLVNSYDPISCQLNNKELICQPTEGSFLFVQDFEEFIIPPDITVVGIENSENFRLIQKQKHLFNKIKPLFVSRYPQSGDIIQWLLSNRNPYLHFGDFDFAGISIYQSEFRKHLKERSSFFYPHNIQSLIKEKGNRSLYNKQLHLKNSILENADNLVLPLIKMIDAEKKGLEQQVLIN